MFNYVSTLRGMTKGRAQYTMQVRSAAAGLAGQRGCRRWWPPSLGGTTRAVTGCLGAWVPPAPSCPRCHRKLSAQLHCLAAHLLPTALSLLPPPAPAAREVRGGAQPHPGEDCGGRQGQGGGLRTHAPRCAWAPALLGAGGSRRPGGLSHWKGRPGLARCRRRRPSPVLPTPRLARILFPVVSCAVLPLPSRQPFPRHDAAPLTILYATTCLPLPAHPPPRGLPNWAPPAPSALPHLIRTLVGSSFEWAAPPPQSPARRGGAPAAVTLQVAGFKQRGE